MDPVIEGTSATEGHIEIASTSDKESTESGERIQIEGASAAAEHTESWERIQWPKNSIFRVPAHMRSGRESMFEPQLVSIGPYYHGREKLQRMEDLKLRCIIQLQQQEAFLVRNHPRPWEEGILHCRNRSIYNEFVQPSPQGKRGIDDVPLESFMHSGMIARAYYKHEFYHSDVEFVRMLVIDSCFIIRIILSLCQQVHDSMGFLDVHIKYVKADLLLLENQIPLFFIKEVYEWIFPCWDHPEAPGFETVLEPFICSDMPWRNNPGAMMPPIAAAHLLDLYWRCSLSPPMYMKIFDMERDLSEQEQPSLETGKQMVMVNASELHKTAGIEFEKFEDKDHLDVIFSNGIMRMPRLRIDSEEVTLLRNLIAFENCILPSMRNISYYMKLMDALIDSDKDVELLQKCGVIYNALWSNEVAATFFNDIGNFCFIDDNANPFSGLKKDVQIYCNSVWHRGNLLSLKQNYFNSPWTSISVIAATTLLILSALQTFYTIYGYYMSKK